MKKLRLYLSHTISIRKEVLEWEKEIESKYNIDLINPFYDLGEIKRMKFIDEGGSPYEGITKSEAEKIVNTDLEAIRESDGVVAYFKCASIGVSMEVMYAKQFDKPVYIYMEDKHYTKHPWLVYFSDNIYTTIEGLNRKLGSLVET